MRDSGVSFLLPTKRWRRIFPTIVLFSAKDIDAQHYGEMFSRVIWLRTGVVLASAIVLIDSIISGQFVGQIKRANFLWFFYIAVAALIAVVKFNDCVPLVCPIVALLLTDIDEGRWVKLMDYFGIGYYISFCFLFTKSLVENPDYYQDGRYIGNFLTVGAAGQIACAAVIFSFYFFARSFYFNEKRKRIIIKVTSFCMLIYPLFAMKINGSRSPESGVILAVIPLFIFLVGKHDKSIHKRFLIVLCGLLLLIISVYSYSVYLNVRYAEDDSAIESLSYLQGHILALTDKNSGQREDALHAGRFMEGLNAFSSGRLHLWRECIKAVKVTKVEGTFYPHNFFIEWLLRYGSIIGVLLIAWFVAFIVFCVKYNRWKNATVILPTLWLAYCLGVFNFTTVQWVGLLPSVLLIVQYPCTKKKKEIGEKDERKN